MQTLSQKLITKHQWLVIAIFLCFILHLFLHLFNLIVICSALWDCSRLSCTFVLLSNFKIFFCFKSKCNVLIRSAGWFGSWIIRLFLNSYGKNEWEKNFRIKGHWKSVWALLCSKSQLKAKEFILTNWVGKQETVFKWDAYLYNNAENHQAETF